MKPRLAIAVLFACAWLVLCRSWPIDAIHFDSSRDLLMARDCYELGLCDSHGPPTSFPGLFQGVLWTNALGLLRWLGATPRAIGVLLAALYALTFAVAQRWRPGPTGLGLWALLLAGSIAMMPVVLWSPTLFFPAMMLTTWLTVDWLAAPTWPLALGVGLLWGVTLDLYLAAGPVLLATLALGLRARKPWQTLAIAALALAVGLIVSPGAWSGTLAFMPLHPLRVLAVLLALAALLLLALRAPRLDNVALLALAGTGAWLVIGATRHFQARYLMPGFPALALLVAQRLPRRWLLAVAAVALVLAPLGAVTPEPQLSYTNAAALADAMTRHGTGWPQALTHAQGLFSRQLAPATAVFLPHAVTPWQGEDVTIDWQPTPRFAATPSRVDLRDAQLCAQTARATTCAPLAVDPTPRNAAFPFAVRGYGAVIPYVPHDVDRLTLRLALRAGTPETLALLPQFTGDACPWNFADGQAAVTLPAAATTVVVQRAFGHNRCPEGLAIYDWLPPWREVPLGPAFAEPLPPPLPVLRTPVLPRGLEPQFADLAARLGPPEPDIAVQRDRAVLTWPGQPPLVLTYARQTPWFQAVEPPADATRAAALAQALPQVFAVNPWREADAPAAAQRAAAKPMWPHLTLAALGLLVLAAAAWRLARRRET